MRVAIAGGNGFIGRRLSDQLVSAGHEVVWLSHRPGHQMPPKGAREVSFEPTRDDGPWIDEVAAADAVVNLSGYPIASRWNRRVKTLLETSRIETTRALRSVIATAREKGGGPTVYVGASGIGIYGDGGETVLAEDAPAGTDWLSRLAVAWEREAHEIAACGCRVVTVRTGLVLGDEGLVPKMALPSKLLVGGPVGTGRQWVPWIAHDDIAAVYRHAIETETLEGPVNACAAEPVRMREFSDALGRVLHRPSWFPVPTFMLKIVLGEVATYMVYSQRASADKLQGSGFTYRLPDLDEALRVAL